ncbi:hydrogenase maturation nickel metallochaperone HypA [Herbaspirillum sp. WGmk3]|uniref:zinc-ribbon domain-containing protein n=1 Tax=Herbaspirillum sp. WGmk3 TaxID=2919925 RepID=UPI00209058CE|nr:zinc-ribbon domain-containing protein [Herbaspirillum sp. WGmk3]MCO4856048.1 hydrogenase maturation nickel metallochaperone HypA [Herbaspirillum sp. WGmk3]
MPMVFCRGCGKEIHDTAPLCPHCGAPQTQATSTTSGSLWLAITSIVSAIFAAICAIQVNSFDHDQLVGGCAIALLALAAGAINLQQKKPGKGISVTAIVLAALSFLILIGS